jgi:site-specific DNA-methyltransferase (adenine-specific)
LPGYCLNFSHYLFLSRKLVVDCHYLKYDLPMNKISLYHGDCLNVLDEIPSKSIDMILCDLPYGTTQNKWDNIIPLDPLWKHYKRLIKESGAVILFCSQPFTSKLIYHSTIPFKYQLIWEKSKATGHLNAKKMPMKIHEEICVFGENKINYYPQDLIPFNKITKRGGNGTNFGKSGTSNFQEFTNYPRSILKFKNENKVVHPTQKPTALLEYLVKTYTKECETILDNCMGSGSTGVASVNTNRSFIGIERDKKYFEIAKKRIDDVFILKNKKSFF